MSEQTTAVAESSAAPAVETPTSLDLPRSGTAEYAEWRVSGTLPEKPKTEPAASSPADTEKAPKADATASPATKQESTEYKPKTEKRFQELLSERDRLKAENEALKAPKPATEPAKPVQQLQQTAQREPTVEDKNQDGTFKYKTYEEFVKAQARWEVRQELAEQRQRETEQTKTQELLVKVNDARTRYGKEKVDEIIFPTSNAIRDDAAIPLAVKAMIGDSEVFPDLIFTLGSDKAEFASFLQLAKTEPGKALRRIANMERLINEELSKGTAAAGRDANGKFTAAQPSTPAKRGPESAPAPPLEIGHRGTGTMDPAADALSRATKGDPKAFREWKAAEDRKALARRRGA